MLLPFCCRYSSLAATIVATSLPPPRKAYAATVAVATKQSPRLLRSCLCHLRLACRRHLPSPLHPHCISAATAKRSPRRRRGLAYRRHFAVAIPVLLPTISPPRFRRRQEKPTPLMSLSPPPCSSPPFRCRHSILAAAIFATLPPPPSKARATTTAIAVPVAIVFPLPLPRLRLHYRQRVPNANAVAKQSLRFQN